MPNRSAFTMMELIFVIVIIGVLAAIAIPKLRATRTDAVISKINQNIGAALEEIANHSNIQDKVENDISKMSQAIQLMITDGYAKKDPNDPLTVYIQAGEVEKCVTLSVKQSGSESNLTVDFNSSIGDNDIECKTLRKVRGNQVYQIQLKGSYVKF